ncbi:MAG: T9SS type A sorting domain-containing protein [Cyclobacteriaceae bacterium]
MKAIYSKKSILTLLMLLSCWLAYSQGDTLVIDSNNGEIGLLNEVIVADTTDTGERANSVYVLKRGQTYILSGSIENRSEAGVRYPLTIIAEDGDGPRPRIVPGAPDGGLSSRPFRARSDITFKGLYITGLDELGGLNPGQRIIRVSADNARIIIDDCHLDQDGQSALRLDNSNNKVYITNSIISNIGQPNNTNNGRLIDDRGNDIDTVVMENNTIYNISSTMMNDRGGWIQYAKLNQNTIVHTGQRIFDFVETQTGIFTNNLVINAGYLGTDLVDTVGAVYDGRYLIEFDTLSEEAKANLPDIEQTLTISNNNIYLDSMIINAYPQDTAAYADVDWGIEPYPVYNPGAVAFGGDQLATNIIEFVSFSNGPSVEDLMVIIDQFWADPNGNDDKSSVKSWDISGEPFDFRYQDSFESATASSTGNALGSAQWEVILSGIGGLRQSLEQAQSMIAGAEAGGNIGQYSQESIDGLNAAIASAEEVLADPSNTPEVFQAEQDALDQAIANFMAGLITSVDRELTNEFLVYPNPTTNFIVFPDPNSVSVEMWSISGRFVGESVIQDNARLSTAGLLNGTYILRITQKDKSIKTFKLIKQ